jgi:hypothetical protein
MARVCAELRQNPAFLRQENQNISSKIKERGFKNIHADYVAAVALGDYLAETIIFGTEPEDARSGALKCAEEIYALNEAQMSADVVSRAWDFIVGWLVSNEHRFSPDASPFYGRSEASPGGQNHEYFVIPQYLNVALEDAGFNVKKTFQGLRERGLIVTQRDSAGKERTKTNGWVYGKQVRGYVFHIRSEGIQPLRGNGNN